MYKVMHWYKSLVGETGIAKIEHYFTDSKKAIEYFFRQTKVHKNVALVISVKHADYVFMSHYSDDLPEELRPANLVEIFTGMMLMICMKNPVVTQDECLNLTLMVVLRKFNN